MSTREQWLSERVSDLRPWFSAAGYTIPADLRISCGWPSTGALRAKRPRIGECWADTASADRHHELFISPAIADPTEVLATLIHELLHASVAHGHKAPFSRAAKALGLVKPWTATTAGAELTQRLHVLIESVPAYPHASIAANTQRKKQSTRMLKALCSSCGYTVRLTQKWADIGMPTCPCGGSIELGEDSK